MLMEDDLCELCGETVYYCYCTEAELCGDDEERYGDDPGDECDNDNFCC